MSTLDSRFFSYSPKFQKWPEVVTFSAQTGWPLQLRLAPLLNPLPKRTFSFSLSLSLSHPPHPSLVQCWFIALVRSALIEAFGREHRQRRSGLCLYLLLPLASISVHTILRLILLCWIYLYWRKKPVYMLCLPRTFCHQAT
jgi:hypothetical protein